MQTMLNLSLDSWDIALIVVVSLQSMVLAYVYHPEWKAFLLTLPFPFTVASLAVGKPMNFTNMLGLLLLALFTHGVRVAYNRYKINIIASIAISASGYCLLGVALKALLPDDGRSFWVAATAVLVAALALPWFYPPKNEPGHRSKLPVLPKMAIIVGIVLVLIVLKKSLGGFMTVFPMVGVLAAYESRNSLWTTSRQIPVVMLSLGALIVAARVVQSHVGVAWALAFGWVVFLAIIIPYAHLKHHSHRNKSTAIP